MSTSEHKPEHGLAYWRERIWRAMMLAAMVLGAAVYAPSAVLAWHEDLWLVLAADTALYAGMASLYILRRRVRYAVRAWALCLADLALGLVLLHLLGPFGAGVPWLFAFPVLAGALLGLRSAAVALGINALVMVAVGFGLAHDVFAWPGAAANSVAKWVVISVNIMFLECVTTLSVVVLLRGLQNTLAERQRVSQRLEAEQTGLLEANKLLRHEIKVRQQLEHQLRQAQKLELVGTLAGGIAHDFNNLLQAVGGYVQIMKMEARDGRPDQGHLAKVDELLGRAGQLTQRLLTISRRVEPRLRPLDLNHEVGQAAEVLARTIPREISVDAVLADDLWPVLADAGQIGQVLLNLGANAKDAMPGGGQLAFRTANVELSAQEARSHGGLAPGRYVLLEVSDTGQGMDAETARQVFQPFFTTKGPGQGTGLGLSMVHGIVQGHHGRVECRSQPGQGATFRVFLPAADAAPEAQAQAAAEAQPLDGQGLVLVVDDEPPIVDSLGQALRGHGYDIAAAASGEEALELLSRDGGKVAAMVLDLSMPGMGGMECLRRAQKLRPRLPVIVTSGYASGSPSSEALAAGATAFVAKPYRFAEVLAVLRRVVRPGGLKNP